MRTFVIESPLRLSLQKDAHMFPSGILNLGWGNGYVVIPHHSWLAGVPYDELDVSVHGGLTFSSYVKHCKWPEIPDSCHPDSWIVGFDTGHYMDDMATCPKEYVEAETRSLMLQLMPLVYPLLY